MHLTTEQQNIIQSKGDIKINAVAGSGKTTTVIEYAKERAHSSRILYIAFNKSVRMEASKRFADMELSHVKVETAHSLAYRHIIFAQNYKIKSNGYKISELVPLLGLTGIGDKLVAYILSNHILKFVTYFCNSTKSKVQELNYRDVVSDPKALSFVNNHYTYIEKQTRTLLGKMDKGEIEIIHDFYLKKFQLAQPVLPFDFILFDEGQDASPAMLDVFFNQTACKVIVGDMHQQIYSWRYAINSLDKADFSIYHLSSSFRFGQDIADLAMQIIGWKNYIGPYTPIQIKGLGNSKEQKTKAILARTNLGLLIQAIKYLSDHPKIKKIYFEGNINSYTYAEDGASLYDVLNLYNMHHDRIKDPLIKSMKNMDELDDYIEKTEDHQLSMMVSLVREYENDIYDILRDLKEKHVGNDERDKAEAIFSTVHRCKGMEYDIVTLADDFVTETKLKALEKKLKENGNISIAKYQEEINLLYVAVTRTKYQLHIPEELVPIGFKTTTNIKFTNPIQSAKADPKNVFKSKWESGKKWNQNFIHEAHDTDDWDEDEKEELLEMLEDGHTIHNIAEQLMRDKSSIRKVIKELKRDGRL